MTTEYVPPSRPRRHSPEVTPEMAGKIKTMLAHGMIQHDIAAVFGINQGRVSEIKTGEKFGDVPPSSLS